MNKVAAPGGGEIPERGLRTSQGNWKSTLQYSKQVLHHNLSCQRKKLRIDFIQNPLHQEFSMIKTRLEMAISDIEYI